MTRTFKSLAYLMASCLLGCSTPAIITNWKAEAVPFKLHHQIMVFAILPGQDSLARPGVERAMVNQLEAIGYPAISGQSFFGTHGLSESTEEKTYLRLCSMGIDAVITITPLPATKKSLHDDIISQLEPHNYYYERIWNYKKLVNTLDQSKKIYWETILFDLATLEARCVLRSRPVIMDGAAIYSNPPISQFIDKMRTEKILSTGKPVRRKAF